MNTQTVQTSHDVQALLAELNAAAAQFEQCVERLTTAKNHMKERKGKLNEHQYPELLRRAASDSDKSQNLMREQDLSRLTYLSGRIGMACSLKALLTPFRGFDLCVRTAMKIFATVRCMERARASDPQMQALALRCTQVLESCRRFHRDLSDHRAEQACDITEGRADYALYRALRDFQHTGTTGLFRENDQNNWTFLRHAMPALMLIDISGLESSQVEDKFAAGVKVNQDLLAALRALCHARYSSGGGMRERDRDNQEYYQARSYVLDRRRYSIWLEDANRCEGDKRASTLAELERRMQQESFDYLGGFRRRKAVWLEWQAMLGRAKALLKDLAQHLETIDGRSGELTVAVMLNVVSASLMIEDWDHLIEERLKEHNDEEKTEAYAAAHDALRRKLEDLVNEKFASSLTWTCSAPGQYSEPL